MRNTTLTLTRMELLAIANALRETLGSTDGQEQEAIFGSGRDAAAGDRAWMKVRVALRG